MKWWKLLLVALLFAPVQMGCEVDGDADDDGASIKIDAD
jgi:hypothetical protein